ncbi:helix-turn-helix transcriptional regulator [Kutzneria buriramensis]|uniref:Helix-turn-helix protein n=1 Tax=Kutzneria buriramensis TaxID=1045776 RepID=A0A3E0HG09_9PSEU|nr:helix-turn-helix transcriptional regulator [Kutzneria buriramensis]REH44661.1 helix-turn-helix protein [Kutzneria buriramensis]
MCGLAKDEVDAPATDPLAELAGTLGTEVREVREGLGWSRWLLTCYSGTSRSLLTRLEEGTALPSVAALTRLASAMGKRVWITLVDEREALPARAQERKVKGE